MGPGRRTDRRQWRRLLDVGTGVLVLLALGFVVHDRVIPGLRRAAEVEVGDMVPASLSYRLHGSGDTVPVAVPGPSLHLVYQSTCPACLRNLPAWKELLDARPGIRVYGVGIEEAPAALAYVRAHLPAALAVGPVDRADYLRRLRIRIVPTTLVVAEDGRLVWRRDGVLAPADVEEALGALPIPRSHHSSEGEDPS